MTKDPHERKKNVVLGSVAAGLAATGAFMLNQPDGSETPPPIAVHSPATPEDMEEKRQWVVRMASAALSPSARKHVKNPPNRVALPPEAKQIAVLLDVTPKSFIDYRFELGNNNNMLTLKAVPQKSTPVTHKVEYNASEIDPINALASSATPEQVEELIEYIRVGYQETLWPPSMEGIHYLGDLPYKDHFISLPKESTDGSGEAFDVAHLPTSSDLVLRINLGKVNSPEYRWLEQLIDIPSELVTALDSHIIAGDPYIHFVKDAVTDPQKHKYDSNAEEMFLKIFSLTDNDRKKFTQSLRNNDIARASEILLHQSAEPLITPSLYNAAFRYAQKAKQLGLLPSDVKKAFLDVYYTQINFKEDYRNPVTEKGTPVHGAPLLLRRSVTEQQFNDLCSLRGYVRDFLVEAIGTANRPPDYNGFLSRIREYEAKNPPINFPTHTLKKIQAQLGQFMGTTTSPGWLDSMDRQRNILSILALLKQRESLTLLFKKPDGWNHRNSSIDRLLSVENGQAYLTIQIPTDDIAKANTSLSLIGRIMQAMHKQQQVLGHEYDSLGNPKPLLDRVADYFTFTQGDPDEPARFPIPKDLMTPLIDATPLKPEIQKALTGDPGATNIRITDPLPSAREFTVRTIERIPENKKQKHAATDGSARFVPATGNKEANRAR